MKAATRKGKESEKSLRDFVEEIKGRVVTK